MEVSSSGVLVAGCGAAAAVAGTVIATAATANAENAVTTSFRRTNMSPTPGYLVSIFWLVWSPLGITVGFQRGKGHRTIRGSYGPVAVPSIGGLNGVGRKRQLESANIAAGK
jgi:hypothetical protein